MLGNSTGMQPMIQCVNENFTEAVEYRKNQARSWEVLICWQGLPKHEALWEYYDEIFQLYPSFHLEDWKGGVMLDLPLDMSIVEGRIKSTCNKHG
ncbi:G patch domain-containing protein 1 [Cucumis melo var. makuwa]|uniref:G patch domain-containing protein 1 n=1 Tax=Cucumis melo var. makuwa TaxID=1194695 RepID=A0A5A7T3S2_CUCMM|nr:G patch domain-containing protein 1 [Cucumis melo var. makuwa]